MMAIVHFLSAKGSMMENKRGILGLAIILMFMVTTTCSQGSQPQVPCFFVFGDSLVDNGNNNGILTLARANYYPYGIDFNQGVTGRFTNGLTFVDALAVLLGFTDYIPPYASARGRSVVRGVNFASGASGIRDETGNNLGAHISMNQQVNNFARLVGQMRRYFRGDQAGFEAHLNKCIYYSGLGSNDYLNNYFMTDYYSTSSQFTPRAFATSLLQDYSRQLTFLYQLGARKIVVTAVGQIGCIPYQLARYENRTGHGHCNEDINTVVSLFNTGLRKMVDRFNGGQLPGSKFVYLDSYQSIRVLSASGSAFKVVDKGCCGVGRNNGQITCLPLQSPCENRKDYLFWDAFHPTEAANILLAKSAYSAKSKSYAYPINIKQLAML